MGTINIRADLVPRSEPTSCMYVVPDLSAETNTADSRYPSSDLPCSPLSRHSPTRTPHSTQEWVCCDAARLLDTPGKMDNCTDRAAVIREHAREAERFRERLLAPHESVVPTVVEALCPNCGRIGSARVCGSCGSSMDEALQLWREALLSSGSEARNLPSQATFPGFDGERDRLASTLEASIQHIQAAHLEEQQAASAGTRSLLQMLHNWRHSWRVWNHRRYPVVSPPMNAPSACATFTTLTTTRSSKMWWCFNAAMATTEHV